MNKRPTHRQAFTIVELLVVLITISVLLGFTTIRLTHTVDSADDHKAQIFLHDAFQAGYAYRTMEDESFVNTSSLESYLDGESFDTVAMASEDQALTAGQVGVYVYASGASAYFKTRSETGKYYWMRSAAGVTTSGDSTPAPVVYTAACHSTDFSGSLAGEIGYAVTDGIYLANYDGSNEQMISDQAKNQFDWNANQNKLLFVDQVGVDRLCTATNNSSVYEHGPFPVNWNTLELSPDGTKVAYTVNGTNNIYIQNQESPYASILVGADSDAWTFAWSPDSTKLAYKTSGVNTKIVNAANGAVLFNFTPASPGGEFAAFQWTDNDSLVAIDELMHRFYRVEQDGSGTTVVTAQTTAYDSSSLAAFGSWALSPDRTKIAFYLSDGNSDTVGPIGVVDVAGGAVTTVLAGNAGVQIAGLDWSPDATRIAYHNGVDLKTAEAIAGGGTLTTVRASVGATNVHRLKWAGFRHNGG